MTPFIWFMLGLSFVLGILLHWTAVSIESLWLDNVALFFACAPIVFLIVLAVINLGVLAWGASV